ncbi:MAG TPA: isoaspartyl peptidase/L-asparaginase [Myxococcaceae bacterium]|nr:isoaspartyl peptidase/L-asparaginase [Myxococcaceae bacterium]
MGPAIAVHGGAWSIPEEHREAHRTGCIAAADRGWEALLRGGSALDAVEAAIRSMEDDPTFDAGTGSVLVADGSVELDAGLMEGSSLKVGAVAAVKHFQNPISLARRVLEASEHHLLVGPGAESFARAQGFAEVDNRSLVVPRERTLYEAFLRGERTTSDSFGPGDTVGAVALDARGHIAAGNSTGGVAFSLPGRVGDAPLPGIGYAADDRFGGVACTGWGEHILRVGLALRAMQGLERGLAAPEAAQAAVALLSERVRGRAGLIVLDRSGRVGLAHSTECLAYAYRTAAAPAAVSGTAVR